MRSRRERSPRTLASRVAALAAARLTYANVMSTIAVAAVLGGSAWAASTIGGAQVRDSSLTGIDIRNGTITSSDVRDRSLVARDFRAGSLPRGPQGPRGLTGARGGPEYLGTIVVQATGDGVANGARLRAALTTAGQLVTSSARTEDEQALVLLEAGDYVISSTLVLPVSVSLAGAVGQASEIRAASGPFTGTAMLRLAAGVGDSDRFIRDIGLNAEAWTSAPGPFTILDPNGADLEASDIEISANAAAGQGVLRGIAYTSDGGRLELSRSRISLAGNGETIHAIADQSAGSSVFLEDVRALTSSGTAASTVLSIDAGFAEIHGGTYSNSGTGLTLAASGGTITSYGAAIDAGSRALTSTGAGSQITLVGGTLVNTVAPSEASGGQVTCLNVDSGLTDATTATAPARTTCA